MTHSRGITQSVINFSDRLRECMTKGGGGPKTLKICEPSFMDGPLANTRLFTSGLHLISVVSMGRVGHGCYWPKRNPRTSCLLSATFTKKIYQDWGWSLEWGENYHLSSQIHSPITNLCHFYQQKHDGDESILRKLRMRNQCQEIWIIALWKAIWLKLWPNLIKLKTEVLHLIFVGLSDLHFRAFSIELLLSASAFGLAGLAVAFITIVATTPGIGEERLWRYHCCFNLYLI